MTGLIKKIWKRIKINSESQEVRNQLFSIIQTEVNRLNPEDALKFLFAIDSFTYELEGQTSIRYGGGVHTKHKHIKYHDFFTKNLEEGENVLDVGSSNGELSTDLAKKVNPGLVYGIEIEEWHVNEANKRNRLKNLNFVHGDVTKDKVLPNIKFDVLTLSNVLEHIEHRPELLKKLKSKYSPKRFLIRVPLFERDWRVPLKKELGIDYRLDETHFIEYTLETFTDEMQRADLEIVHMEVRWGEIWAVLK